MKVGDEAIRILSNTVNIPVVIGEITEDVIKVGSKDGIIPWEIGWTFSKKTLMEIDEDLGWDGITKSGSYLVLLD